MKCTGGMKGSSGPLGAREGALQGRNADCCGNRTSTEGGCADGGMLRRDKFPLFFSQDGSPPHEATRELAQMYDEVGVRPWRLPSSDCKEPQRPPSWPPLLHSAEKMHSACFSAGMSTLFNPLLPSLVLQRARPR